ncbi:MAG: Gfo/Idh/MocA family protein [Planctomycetota bacterium]|jgi:predicted dehydrogenase
MTERQVRVGIIGAGGNTKAKHIPGLKAIAGVAIVGVCNRSRESSEAVAGEFGIPKVYDEWQDAASDGEADAIVIGTWPYLHCPATLAALEAGKHVMCEARMAMNAAEAHAMYAAARRRPQLVAQVVPSPFTLRVDLMVKRLLGEGYLGEPLAVEVRDGGGFIDRHSPMTWRQDAELSGHNVLALGIWYEAVMRWIGPASRVMAMGGTFVKRRSGPDGEPREIGIPDHVDVVAEMECGARAAFRFSAVTGLAERCVWLFGSEGTLKFAGERLYGARRGEKRLEEIKISPELEGRWRVEEEFIGAIRGREKIEMTTFADGVRYMEFTEAVARSMAVGEAVELPLHCV